MDISSVTLEVVEEKIRKHIDLMKLENANFDVDLYIDEMAKSLVVELTRKRAHQFLGSITIKRPANWWEHFKETFFPAILLQYFPVKYEHIVVSAETFYDRIALPKETTEFRIHAVEGRVQ